jgi:hypothetical protein
MINDVDATPLAHAWERVRLAFSPVHQADLAAHLGNGFSIRKGHGTADQG